MIISALILLSAAHGEILCRRDADITPVQPKFESSDSCEGSVKLQGISYRCADPSDYSDLMRDFLRDLRANGEKWCTKYCRKKGWACAGRFVPPSQCGWAVPRNQVLKVGKTAPCPGSCDGQAFIYCSIYHASYLKIDPKAFSDYEPNCFCERQK